MLSRKNDKWSSYRLAQFCDVAITKVLEILRSDYQLPKPIIFSILVYPQNSITYLLPLQVINQCLTAGKLFPLLCVNLGIVTQHSQCSGSFNRFFSGAGLKKNMNSSFLALQTSSFQSLKLLFYLVVRLLTWVCIGQVRKK